MWPSSAESEGEYQLELNEELLRLVWCYSLINALGSTKFDHNYVNSAFIQQNIYSINLKSSESFVEN